jgi:hypothetical protein
MTSHPLPQAIVKTAALLLASLMLAPLQGCAYLYDQAADREQDRCERFANAHYANYDEWKDCRARRRAVQEEVERRRKAADLSLAPSKRRLNE